MKDLSSLLDEVDSEEHNRIRGEALAQAMFPVLRAHGGWMPREDLAKACQVSVREIRLGREHSGGAIIFGQNGLRASETATVEEVQHCVNIYRSQARAMTLQAIRVDQFLHRGKLSKTNAKLSHEEGGKEQR